MTADESPKKPKRADHEVGADGPGLSCPGSSVVAEEDEGDRMG
jgi:hypothetical protein